MLRSIPTALLLMNLAGVVCAAGPPIPIASRLQLFVDAHLLAAQRGTQLRLHPPQPREVVLALDAPWEGPMSGYVTMMADDGVFRMYYRGGGETTEEVVCMATSRDGVKWERPNLGLVEFKKSKANNILLRGQRKAYWEAHNFTPFKDTNPATPPELRYKAMGLGRYTNSVTGEREKALVALVSPDGVQWKLLRPEPIITKGSFDSQNTVFWDTTRREYVAYVRDGRTTPDGRRVRSVLRATSKDFLNWTDPVWLDFGDSPLEQFYVNNIAPYPREPSLYLGFPMRFVPERKTVGADARKVDGVSDAVLISSRDGLRFDRTFMEAFLRPGLSPQNWGNAHGNNTPAWGLLATGPNELSLYWTENYGATPLIRRGTVRVDGFASVNAGFAGGEFVTKPLTFTGGKLVLNYSTSAIGNVRVELQDAAGQPLDGFRLDDCPEIFGDETARAVAWQGSPSLAALAGKPVRLRVALKDADVFSFRFGE